MFRATAFMAIALARPSTVGAIMPSSRHLADAMARGAAGAQRLIELGAGTGAITEALCRCYPGLPTLAVEMEPALAEHLRKRFPQIEVCAVAAHQVLQRLQRAPGSVVLVSSLPFRSLPLRLRLRSSLAIERFLPATRRAAWCSTPMRRACRSICAWAHRCAGDGSKLSGATCRQQSSGSLLRKGTE